MQTAHQIVASFIAAKAIDMADFNQWFEDGGYSQDEANIHDSRYLNLLETFVEERDTERASPPGTAAMTSTKVQATGIVVFGPSPCPRHGLDYSETCRDCSHHRYPVPYDPPPVWPRSNAIETSENPDAIKNIQHGKTP